ncbi:MAG: response regulator [Bacteroidota bacterium]
MKKILIIEDTYEVRDNIVEILSLSNYEVDEAENGIIGIEKAQTSPPDLILCDVMMPDLDGFGVLHILSKKPVTANIPFIFLTAKSEKADFRKGMNLGADDYITKPFDPHELLEVVEMRLKKNERKAAVQEKKGSLGLINESKGRRELQELIANREVRTFRKRDAIYKENELPRQLYYLQSGKVKTFRTNDFGKTYITHIYNAGDFLGYQALIKNTPYHESAVAMENCRVALIPKKDFLPLLANSRHLSNQFIKLLAQNIEEHEEQLLSLAYSSIRKRVAQALLKLNEQSRNSGQANISILRDDFASMVGTAKESVIRTLAEFKTEGLIEVDNGLITVIDQDKLYKIPC